MPDPSPAREFVEFSSLDQAVERLERLHRTGYRSLGKWNLAQICEHLSDWMDYMLDGYPAAPLPVRMMLWGVRATVGRSMLRKTIATGRMPAGGPTMKQTVHAAQGLEDEASLQRFRRSVARFQACTAPYHPSPLFGPLSAEEGLRLQLVHCAHHISFLKSADSNTAMSQSAADGYMIEK